MRQAVIPKLMLLAALLAGAPTLAAERTASVDESALRYYAALGETARVEAETRRLSRLHPGWQAPADLGASEVGAADEGDVWDLLAADRLAEARAALAARAAAEPGWRPSPALAAALRRREVRAEILSAAQGGRWAEAADRAARGRADLDPRDVTLAWSAAEAFARAERPHDAAALLRAVMDDPRASQAERTGTVEKAMALLAMAEAETLIARGRTRPDGTGEFDAIGLDITRARLSAELHDAPANPVDPAARTAFEAYAREAADPNQAGLVAWHAFRARRYEEALAWFKHAVAHGGDAMIAHGLAHTLRALGYVRDAEEVAYAWREPLIHNAVLFVDLLEADLTRPLPPVIEPERLARYAAVTLATASGEGAQGLAWYAYNACQFETALDWFRRAVAWHPKEATVYGYALTLRRLRRQRDFIEVVNRYDGLFPKVVGLLFEPADRPGPCDAPAQAVAVRPAEPRALRVPVPADASARPAMARRGDFPLPVGPENDLRFASAAGTPPLALRSRERPMPLLARRVPGVIAMPYERLGGTLLPARDGTSGPSPTSAAEQPAPLGTLWAQGQHPAPMHTTPSPTASAASAPIR